MTSSGFRIILGGVLGRNRRDGVGTARTLAFVRTVASLDHSGGRHRQRRGSADSGSDARSIGCGSDSRSDLHRSGRSDCIRDRHDQHSAYRFHSFGPDRASKVEWAGPAVAAEASVDSVARLMAVTVGLTGLGPECRARPPVGMGQMPGGATVPGGTHADHRRDARRNGRRCRWSTAGQHAGSRCCGPLSKRTPTSSRG